MKVMVSLLLSGQFINHKKADGLAIIMTSLVPEKLIGQ